MKTPLPVGRYRFRIAHNMQAGKLTIEQAENLQQMTDNEIMRLIMSDGGEKCLPQEEENRTS